MSRRTQIEEMLAEDPHDTFLRYSLAMELHKEGESEAAVERLVELQQDSPPYVPAYFMAGQFLAERGHREEARQSLQVGIEAARSQGDAHAAGEMAEFLATLGSEGT